MDIWRAGEALLRRQPQIFNSLVLRQPSRISIASIAPNRTLRTPSRCLSTTRRLFRDDASKPNPNGELASSSESSDAKKGSINDILNESLNFTGGTPTSRNQRTSRYATPSAQAKHRIPSDGTSAGDMYDFTKTFNPPRSSQQTQRQKNTTDLSSIASFLNDFGTSNRNSGPPGAPREQLSTVKLGPSTGRTVKVDASKGMDIGRAFRTLDAACARNKVRSDFQRQRFHERPGLKRKRLKSERWRRRFKEGFRGMVKMVNQMKKKGW
ncbi:hypothetical protein H2203_007788 [Taxawa tesnikishii (nom. ined.)]|nr:hypothetical protein H2203_007788 [Dothideales sp. JES 119]